MNNSKSIRITNEAERKLKSFIRKSPRKVYKIQFASDAVIEKINAESQPKPEGRTQLF
jgi:hypothetical protein